MRNRAGLIALAAAASMLASVLPAFAGVTAASIGPTNQNYSGQCPTTVRFTGSITYTAFTTFTYSFNRFVNGVQQVVTGGTVTTGSGSLSVSDAITISSTASGSTFDQLWVHKISGGQTDVYSNKATFTVNCGFVFNPPHNRPVPIHFGPNAPVRLTDASNNPTLCYAHVNQLFCDASLQSGDIALVWDWSDNQWPNIDGFRLFRVDKGQHSRVQDVSLGDAVTGTFDHPHAGGACYAIAAYSGAAVSQDSNTVCVGGGSLVKTDEFSPNHVKYAQNAHGKTGGFIGATGYIFGQDHYGEGVLAVQTFGYVGFYHSSDSGLLESHYYSTYARSAAAFDLGSLVGHHVYKAILKATITDAPYAECAKWIAPGVAAWWNDGNMIERDSGSAVSTGNTSGPNVSFDVTSIVQSWAQGGAQNFGLVLYQDDENLGDAGNSQCQTHYDSNPRLDVTHD
ncbi:MAG TPA: DNRLRE domain-containing protein [Vicinamibacterales bacterium]